MLSFLRVRHANDHFDLGVRALFLGVVEAAVAAVHRLKGLEIPTVARKRHNILITQFTYSE